MSKSEFVRSSPAAGPEENSSSDEAMAREFMGLRLAYDPYSPTAEIDYEELRDQLHRFDITGMLARELRKSRIDEGLSRRLVKAMRYLPSDLRDAAVVSVIRNFGTLFPIFPSVAILLHQILPDLSENSRSEVFGTIRRLITDRSHILLVPANLCFAVRILCICDRKPKEN